jgi:hypothetical protein
MTAHFQGNPRKLAHEPGKSGTWHADPDLPPNTPRSFPPSGKGGFERANGREPFLVFMIGSEIRVI